MIVHGGQVLKLHAWATGGGRVKVSFLASEQWKVYREELLGRGVS